MTNRPTTSAVDFTSSRAPSIDEFALKVVFMLIVWACLLAFVNKLCQAVARKFWSYPVPITSASIPSKLPHPNPQGSAVSFDIPLMQATDEQIGAFMKFRGCETWPDEKQSRDIALRQVAHAAAEYKGFLYEERTMKWIDDHFRLRLPKLKYPYVDSHWNGWSSFWIETGEHIRNMFLSSVAVLFEHCINGLMLPVCYLITHNDAYLNVCLYSEVGYMVYATMWIIISYVYNKDVTVEQMHRSVWPLLLVHHISSLILCIGCIYCIESAPKELICWVLLALLGLTSSLHYVGQILDFSPFAQANKPWLRMSAHIVCLCSQIVFRMIYWLHIVYMTVTHTLEAHGTQLATLVLIILVLFTVFNADFVKFHYKATKGCWLKIQQGKRLVKPKDL